MAAKIAHRQDGKTGLIHTMPPASPVTDCGLVVRDMAAIDKKAGQVKEGKWCPTCMEVRNNGRVLTGSA